MFFLTICIHEAVHHMVFISGFLSTAPPVSAQGALSTLHGEEAPSVRGSEHEHPVPVPTRPPLSPPPHGPRRHPRQDLHGGFHTHLQRLLHVNARRPSEQRSARPTYASLPERLELPVLFRCAHQRILLVSAELLYTCTAGPTKTSVSVSVGTPPR